MTLAYHDDLIDQAVLLVNKETRKPKQASLRRAISSAYYAIFHLLISACVANWKHPEQRAVLGRALDHSTMRSASKRTVNASKSSFTAVDPLLVADLKFVASTFTDLQDQRHIADYDHSKFWTKTDALSLVAAVQQAFLAWKRIEKHSIAQEYLLSLLVKKRD